VQYKKNRAKNHPNLARSQNSQAKVAAEKAMETSLLLRINKFIFLFFNSLI